MLSPPSGFFITLQEAGYLFPAPTQGRRTLKGVLSPDLLRALERDFNQSPSLKPSGVWLFPVWLYLSLTTL